MNLNINNREVFEIIISNNDYYETKDKIIYEDKKFKIRLMRYNGHLFLTISDIPPGKNSLGLVLFDDYFKPYMFKKEECYVLYVPKYLLGYGLEKIFDKLKMVGELNK